MKEDLRQWFGKGKEGGAGGGGWDRYNTKGERIGKCAREPGEPKPKCLSKEKAAKMSKSDIASAVRRKRKSDPVADRSGKGGKPKMVSNNIGESNCGSGGSGEERFCQLCGKNEYREECGYGPLMWDRYTTPRILDNIIPEESENKDKEREKQQMLANKRKMIQKQQMLQKQTLMLQKQGKLPLNYGEENEVITNEAVERINRVGKTYMVFLTFRGQYKSLQFFFPTAKRPTRQEVLIQISKIYPGAVLVNFIEKQRDPNAPVIYVDGATTFENFVNEEKNIGGGNLKKLAKKATKRVDNDADGDVDKNDKAYIVPGVQEKLDMKKVDMGDVVKDFYKSDAPQFKGKSKEKRREMAIAAKLSAERNEEVIHEKSPAWTRKAGKNSEGGLNAKGRKSYERENPGSDLKAPSKKVGNPRRASFCARMKGMKKKLTSSKTANDPDSRINKSLRAWNC